MLDLATKLKNRCPWFKCNKEVVYNGTSIVGMHIDGQLKAVHKDCFHNVAFSNALRNALENNQ